MAGEYDFSDFLARMSQLDLLDILVQADRECGAVERMSVRGRGAPQRRKDGSLQYAHRIKEFLYFMRFSSRPSSASEWDFQSYKTVVKALVEKKQLKPEVLDLFH